MLDTTTQKPLTVTVTGTAGPYIRVPFAQLADLRQLLDSGGVFYWVRENVISFDGGPEIARIELGRNGDAAAVQAILDGIR